MIRSMRTLSVGLLVAGLAASAFGQAAPGQVQQPAQPELAKIYTVDDDGMPVPPGTWLDIAALTVNPTLSADDREKVEAAVREWLAGVQKLVVENPDLTLEIAQGLYDDLDLEERAGLAHASEVMKAIGTVPNLSSYLVTGGVLSNEQGETNRMIVQQYVRVRSEAMSKHIMSAPPEEQQRQMQTLMARTTMTSMTDDARRMFRSVAVRGAPHAGAALSEAGLESSEFSAELEAVQRADTDEARFEAMAALMDQMEGMQLFRFADALAGKLPPIELPELEKIGQAGQSESETG